MHYELDGEALAQAAFPVTIDPLIRSANANKYTEFTCLADGQSLPYSQAQDHIKTGAYNGKQCVGMLRFLSLAPLEASDTVIQGPAVHVFQEPFEVQLHRRLLDQQRLE